MRNALGRAGRVVRRTYREIAEDRVTGLAAEVAFFAVLSVFPGLLMVAAALGSLERLVGSELAARSKEQILDFLHLVLTDQAGGAIEAVETLFADESGGLITVASVAALWALSRGFAAIVRALNLAYDVRERRRWLSLRLLSLGLALGSVIAGAVLLAMVVVGPLLGRGEDVADFIGAGDVFAFAWRYLRWPVALVLLIAWATTLFHIAPNRVRTPWREDIPGAALTAALWLASSLGLNLYLQVVAGGNPVFGILGGGLILLIWLYLLSLSLLIGGEFNAVLKEPGAAARPGTPEDAHPAVEADSGPADSRLAG